MDKEVRDRLEKLEEKLDYLMNKRMAQVDILPDAIKMRHISEGIRFVRGGATAQKPTVGEGTMQGYAMFYDTTAKKLYIWNSDLATPAWESVTLS